MLEFRQKRATRRMLYSTLTIVVLFGAAVILAKAAWNAHGKAAESSLYLSQARDELATASSTQAGLAASVGALETQEGVETEIRSQFLVAKPGEQVAVIVDPGDGTDTDDIASSTSGFWQWLGGMVHW